MNVENVHLLSNHWKIKEVTQLLLNYKEQTSCRYNKVRLTSDIKDITKVTTTIMAMKLMKSLRQQRWWWWWWRRRRRRRRCRWRRRWRWQWRRRCRWRWLRRRLRGNRELKQRRRRSQRERQKSLDLDWQNNISARASRFFVHFFAVTAGLQRENT